MLIDTHVFLWWRGDDPRLGEEERQAIRDGQNDVLLSAASIWEIAIKRQLGKLEAPDELASQIADEGFLEAPITAADAERAGALPALHQDPFDRMLVAQAERLDAIVITRDPAFERYGTRVLPASDSA